MNLHISLVEDDFLEPFRLFREILRESRPAGWGQAPEGMMEEVLTDEELLEKAATGDEPAFTRLYRRRQGPIYRFVLQLTGSRALAEELTQEVFLIMIQRTSDFDPSRGTLKSYLYGVARNLVLRCRWEGQRWDRIEGVDEVTPGSQLEQPDPLSELQRSETVRMVQRAVLALPRPYREAVILCDLHELSYAEAATILDCSVGTIRSRLHRGRALLVDRIPGASSSIKPESGEGLPSAVAQGDQSWEDPLHASGQIRSMK